MAGKKGRSGRKSIRDEEKRLRIIEKAWEVTGQYLRSPDIELKDKIEVACRITMRDMPQSPLVNNKIINSVKGSNDTGSFDEREKEAKEELRKLFGKRA